MKNIPELMLLNMLNILVTDNAKARDKAARRQYTFIRITTVY